MDMSVLVYTLEFSELNYNTINNQELNEEKNNKLQRCFKAYSTCGYILTRYSLEYHFH